MRVRSIIGSGLGLVRVRIMIGSGLGLVRVKYDWIRIRIIQG